MGTGIQTSSGWIVVVVQLTLVAIGKNEAAFGVFDRTHIGDTELILVANIKGESLSSIANRYLLKSRDVFGLCHNNTWFGPGSLEIFTRTAMEGKVCGVVGRILENRSRWQDEYHWCQAGSAKVSTLDGCAVFFPVRSGLRFDEKTFDGFHCHVPDLCLQAQKIGMEVVVPEADASHKDSDHTSTESTAWQRDYWRYVALLEKKWKGTRFKVT